MASFVSVSCPLNLLCLFVFTATSSAAGNTTSYTLNTTSYLDLNVSVNATETFTTAEYESTTPTQTSSTTEDPPPALPAVPLPLSGRLLSPVTAVDRLCPCDVHRDVCDINCCCDRECGEEAALFTSCSTHTVSGSRQLCSQDVASYSLRTTIDGYAEVQSAVQRETSYSAFCIQAQNRVDSLSHPSPALPTDNNFDSLFSQFTSVTSGSGETDAETSAAEDQASPGYQYGDVMATAGERGERGVFQLPAPGVTNECLDSNPAVFLKQQRNLCSRYVVLDRDCSALPALSADAYANVRLFAGKRADAAVVPVEVSSLVRQSLDGTQTEVSLSDGENLKPELLSPGLCANVLLKVAFVLTYSPAGEVVKAAASLLLGFVREDAMPLEQEFHIQFVQESGKEAAVRYSGNPGYVVGLPLVSGRRVSDGIARSIDPTETLSILRSAEDQDCLRGPHGRSPVLFGEDSVAGCTLRLQDAANCSLVSQILLEVLRGPNYPQYVASFGSSPLHSPLDWVPIKSNSKPVEAQSCNIPLSLHLDIEWTKFGSLVNPQARIVAVREEIQTNASSLDLMSGGGDVLFITSSVTFTPVSDAARPGFRAAPTIDAKLPFDFFFPFV